MTMDGNQNKSQNSAYRHWESKDNNQDTVNDAEDMAKKLPLYQLSFALNYGFILIHLLYILVRNKLAQNNTFMKIQPPHTDQCFFWDR